MIIKYNTEKLTRIVEDIFILTGISIDILDADYNSIAANTKKQKYCSLLQTLESEKKLCALCDRKILNKCRSTQKLERHICRAGLYDSAMPIIKYDTLVGFVILGQVRSGDSPELPQYIPDADTHTIRQLKRFYKELPFISEDRLDALYDLLPRILFGDDIDIVYDSFVNKAVEFIDANLKEKLTIDLLCEEFHVSKNYLYEAFRSNLKSTVIGYINEKRIRMAKDFLEQSDASVYEIAEKVGIDNYTYFCKLFKKLSGVTPTQYRKICSGSDNVATR